MKAITLLLFLVIFAQSNDINIQSFFSEITEYSNKEKINIDHQPSVLTILDANNLEKLGVRTLNEALDYIPGIETGIHSDGGTHQFTMRGDAQPRIKVYEKTKYFIDGVDIKYYYHANFPIELIERVEVLRGGSTAVYGQGAFSSVVNIVTKANTPFTKNRVTFESGSFNNQKTTGIFKTEIDNYKISSDIYYHTHDREIDAHTENLTTFNTPFEFPRDKTSLEGLYEKGVGVKVEKDNLKLSIRRVDSKSQNYYGFLGHLDFNDKSFTQYVTTVTSLQYKKQLSDKISVSSKLNKLTNKYFLNSYYYKVEPNNLGLYDPHFQVDFIREHQSGNLEFSFKNLPKHTINFGVDIGKDLIKRNDYNTNVDFFGHLSHVPTIGFVYPITPTLTKLDGEEGFLTTTKPQEIRSYYMSDIYRYSDSLDFAFDLRYDDYDYVQKMKSWRFASVYSNNGRDIYKLIATSSPNVPSFVKAYLNHYSGAVGNADLKPERRDNIELAYIYSTLNEKLQLNIYHSQLKDNVTLKADDVSFNYTFLNAPGTIKNYGGELEYSRKFSNRSKLMFNISFSQFQHNHYYGENFVTKNTPNTSKVLSNLSYIYPINAQVTLSPMLRYYGKKRLLEGNEISPTTLVDLSLEYKATKDLKFNFIGKNIFNRDYYYYSFQAKDEKVLREKATWFARAEYSF